MGEYTGKSYCPSNGSEGMWFTEKFCEQCIHEKFSHTQKHGDKQCEILNNSMLFDYKDERYPKEWTYDENNNPTCTSFSKWDWGSNNDEDGLNEPPDIEPIDPNQLCLPFITEEIEGKVINMAEYQKNKTIKHILEHTKSF